jgi:hypothetical protein
MDEVVYASNFTGYVEAGESTSSNSYAAIMAAITAANARNRPLIIQGRPRITQSIKLTAPTHIKFEGSHFVPGQLNGGTALIKASSCTGPAIQINPAAFGTVIDGGGIIGEVGNTGDGLVIWGNSVVVRDFGVQGMGRDGIRIGGYVLGDTWYDATLSASVNANSFRLDNVISNLNGRDGMQVDDQKGGAIDANTGLVSRCQFNNNARHGLYCDKTYLGTVFDGCLFEANTNYGISLGTNTNGLAFLGGDTEANVAGQVLEAVARANDFYGHSVQGVIWDTRNQRGAFTPTISGTTVAGAGTYTIQKGRYRLTGEGVKVDALITWTAHTGTGNLRVPMPAGILPNSADATIPAFLAVQVLPNGASLTVPANAIMCGIVNSTGQYVDVYYVTPGAATLTAFPICAAGSIIVSATYETSPAIGRL